MYVDTENFQIILQKGIEPGFAPPTPTSRYVITRVYKADVFDVSTEIRPVGTPKLQPPTTKQLKLADYAERLANLFALLSGLQTQYPGTEDMYGRNIAIWSTEPGVPVEFHESTLVVALSMRRGPDPTEDQKDQFDEAVKVIEGLAREECA